ncbi:hypothetical protein HOJ01_00615 [bacterium]|jgi:hypothetical protein|nr:hypothetical protein [bacterium]MBT6293291.1 hypothetical protein [bacterium]
MNKKITLSNLVKETILILQVFLCVFILFTGVLIIKNNSKTQSLGYKIQENKLSQNNLLKVQEEIQNKILKNKSINNLKNKVQIINMKKNKNIEFLEGRYVKLSKK